MKFKLAFAIHNHQPVGNFSAVFQEAHQKCYSPFLNLIKNYPDIKMSLHQSGILWDWQKQHHPEFFSFVGELVDSGQVELLSGGFFEPILPSIPRRDKIGQISMLNTFLKNHFEVNPRGLWLAERVWEPHLPEVLNECGLRYLPIDDTHFRYAGVPEERLFGTFVTEEAGRAITLLPISKRLRYLIPFGNPEDVIGYLREMAEKHPGGMAVYADDGEKFGVWPGTYKHCFENKWLERFFEILSQNSDWLEVVSLGQAVEETHPIDRVYLPSASYSEMLQWALPTEGYEAYEEFEDKLREYNLFEEYGRFVRGGHWRGFLTKYPESNLMHKKMLMISDLLDKVSCLEHTDKDDLEKAKNFLYAGQCNCAYWHGVFGGLYLPHLRWAIYNKLIRAEKILQKLVGKEINAEFMDFEADGYQEIVVNNKSLSMVISPRRGGKIVDLSCFSGNINLVDCLARRREGYHKKLLNLHDNLQGNEAKSIHDTVVTKEKGLEKLLIDDKYLRRPLADHFLSQDLNLKSFSKGDYAELGDFVDSPFESSFEENQDHYIISLVRRGNVWYGDYRCPLKLQKKIFFPQKGGLVDIEYSLIQNNLEILPVCFGIEFDFNLLAPDAENRYALIDGIRPDENSQLAATESSYSALRVSYIDENQKVGIDIEADQKCTIWRMPIYTVSSSEGGFEKVFQGNSTLLLFNKALASGQEVIIKLKMYAGPLDNIPVLNSGKEISASKA